MTTSSQGYSTTILAPYNQSTLVLSPKAKSNLKATTSDSKKHEKAAQIFTTFAQLSAENASGARNEFLKLAGETGSPNSVVTYPIGICRLYSVYREGTIPSHITVRGSSIGSGGFARVYLAKHISLDPKLRSTTIALKVPGRKARTETYAGEQLAKRVDLLKDAITGSSKYLNLPTELYLADNKYVFEHELFDEDLNSSSIQDIGQALKVMRHITKGLKTLHDAGFVHGDLKGKNILVKDIQDKPRAALTDFDTSRQIDAPKEPHIAMTPHYACPSIFPSLLEQFKGSKGHFTIYSDFFALGRTIECDIVSNFLSQHADLNNLSDDASIQHLQRCTFQKIIHGPFEEGKIKEYENEYQNRCLLSEQNLKLHIFETIEIRMQAFHTVLELFAAKNILNSDEVEALTTIIDFALNSLQNPDLSKRKNLEETLDLTKILSLTFSQKKRPAESVIEKAQLTKMPRVDYQETAPTQDAEEV